MILLDRIRRAARHLRGFGRPLPMSGRDRKLRPERMLMVAMFDPRGLHTVVENIRLLGSRSRFPFDLVNVGGLLEDSVAPARIRLGTYDGVFIHCTTSYDPGRLARLDRLFDQPLAEYSGVKVLMKQDEQFRTNELVDFVEACGVDLISTCVNAANVRRVYPRDRVRSRFVHSLTGYVSEEMRALAFDDDQRSIDVGYRGSRQPLHFGRLAYEKRLIGEVVAAACRARGLTTDISSRWEDRHLGPEWFRFLGRCKATLGVESGASVFDWDGSVERDCAEFVAQHPTADFHAVHAAVLAEHDGLDFYNQVSPRHFEAAACRTLQILYEGAYSGIFRPDRHYLALRRDHANLDDVLDRASDPAERKRITECAHEEIVQSPAHWYETHIEELDCALETIFDER